VRYYIISGEQSGDIHGANLISSLRKIDRKAHFRAWGGRNIKETGVEIVKDIEELAFMGFWEILINIRTIVKNFKLCKRDINKYQPDALILIDYPGFNLRIAKWAKKNNYRVFYYISPQVWAWKESRVKQIKKNIEKLFVILPFEKEFYHRKHGFDVEYVGHPLLDYISQFKKDVHFFKRNKIPIDKPIIALLPGSRRQEIKKILPIYISVAKKNPQWTFIVARVSFIPIEFYEILCRDYPIRIVEGATYDLLQNARAAIVTSGTATLETGLFRIPQVVCYKTSWFSYRLARLFINIKYISLVNLILNESFITELIQSQCNSITVNHELQKIVDSREKEYFEKGYRSLCKLLDQSGASDKTARLINDAFKN